MFWSKMESRGGSVAMVSESVAWANGAFGTLKFGVSDRGNAAFWDFFVLGLDKRNR